MFLMTIALIKGSIHFYLHTSAYREAIFTIQLGLCCCRLETKASQFKQRRMGDPACVQQPSLRLQQEHIYLTIHHCGSTAKSWLIVRLRGKKIFPKLEVWGCRGMQINNCSKQDYSSSLCGTHLWQNKHFKGA